jgi:putative superfamily III holin-X
MEELKRFEDLFDHAKEYVNTRIDEAKLTTAEKVSGITALLIARSVVSVVFLFCLLFASVAAAYGLGAWLGKIWLGFLEVSAFYLVIGLFVWTAKGWLIRIPVMNAIIHQLFKNDTSDEND